MLWGKSGIHVDIFTLHDGLSKQYKLCFDLASYADFITLVTFRFPNLGIEHVTKKMVGKVLMDRYIKMQTLHTATLNALTSADGKGFDVTVLGDHVDGDRSSFDKRLAEAVAGVIDISWILTIFSCAGNLPLADVELKPLIWPIFNIFGGECVLIVWKSAFGNQFVSSE